VTSAAEISTAELVRELQRRGAMPRCPCGKWGSYLGAYDADGYTLRCYGCLRAVARCTCR
jgi:hypothetical protein